MLIWEIVLVAPSAVIVALLFSAGGGRLSRILPARRAAELDFHRRAALRVSVARG